MNLGVTLFRAGLFLLAPRRRSASRAPRWSVIEPARTYGHPLAPVAAPLPDDGEDKSLAGSRQQRENSSARTLDKAILFPEGWVESGKFVGQWKNGERNARNRIGDFRNWVGGFFDWNIVFDQRGGPNHVGNFCEALAGPIPAHAIQGYGRAAK